MKQRGELRGNGFHNGRIHTLPPRQRHKVPVGGPGSKKKRRVVKTRQIRGETSAEPGGRRQMLVAETREEDRKTKRCQRPEKSGLN